MQGDGRGEGQSIVGIKSGYKFQELHVLKTENHEHSKHSKAPKKILT